MLPQYITDSNGKKISVILPIKDYEKLLEALDDIEDIILYDQAIKYKSKPVLASKAFQQIEAKRRKKS